MTPKSILTHTIALYLGAGLFAASLIGASIPALNMLGHMYITLTWPALVYCAPVHRACDGMPPDWAGPYLFSFPAVAS
jgi:hypothetical protein